MQRYDQSDAPVGQEGFGGCGVAWGAEAGGRPHRKVGEHRVIYVVNEMISKNENNTLLLHSGGWA